MSELPTLAGAGLLLTALAIWATQPPKTCALITEPHRQLNLERQVDREHLERDAREILRMARRYALQVTARTRNDDSEVDRVIQQCQGILARQVMTTHGVTRDQIIAALPADR
jgi:hypothetical protein